MRIRFLSFVPLLFTLLPGVSAHTSQDESAPPTTVAGTLAVQQSTAAQILRRADKATAAVHRVSYDYEYLGLGPWPGRIAGSVLMRQVTDQSDSWIRTTGTIIAPPAGYENAARHYDTSIDGATAYFIDRDRRTFESAPYEQNGNHLSRNQVYEALYQFVNPSPFAFELNYHAALENLGVSTVESVECDTIKVTYERGTGMDEAVWYIGRQDALPRAVMMTAVQVDRPAFFYFRISNLRTGVELEEADFILEQPEGYALVGTGEAAPKIGAKTAAWTLETASGETVSAASLRGQVVVLDFWVTHCPFCKMTMPQIQELHEAYRGRPVRFLGVNVWESGDAAEYMRNNGFSYDTLLRGEPLADLYGFQWQPALVVLGPDGTILLLEGGATRDRAAGIRKVVDEALAGM